MTILESLATSSVPVTDIEEPSASTTISGRLFILTLFVLLSDFLKSSFTTVCNCLLEVYSGVSYSGPNNHLDSVTSGCNICSSSTDLSFDSFLIASITDNRLSISLNTVNASLTDHFSKIELSPIMSSSLKFDNLAKSSWPFFEDSSLTIASTAKEILSLLAVGVLIVILSIISSTSYNAKGVAFVNLLFNSFFIAALVSSMFAFATFSNIDITYSLTVS